MSAITTPVSATGTASDILDFVNDASEQAAAWYTGLNPSSPVVVPGTVGSTAALQAQLSSAAAVTTANPLLGSLLSNPTLLILLLAFTGFIIWIAVK